MRLDFLQARHAIDTRFFEPSPGVGNVLSGELSRDGGFSDLLGEGPGAIWRCWLPNSLIMPRMRLLVVVVLLMWCSVVWCVVWCGAVRNCT